MSINGDRLMKILYVYAIMEFDQAVKKNEMKFISKLNLKNHIE